MYFRLTEALKQRFIDELRRFWSYHPRYNGSAASSDEDCSAVNLVDNIQGKFSFEEQVYSQGDMKYNPWDEDFYDDAIASFDGYVEQIYNYLGEKGMLNNTILIIYSDHGLRYRTNVQIPLIMYFPDGEFAQELNHNTANVDISPTLLDYMGLPKPDWMDGISLIGNDLSESRVIYSIIAGSPKKVAAPFYQIKTVQAVLCQGWYQLNVQENQWKSGAFPDYASACDSEQLPADEDIRERIIQYLSQHGFEADSLNP